MIPINLNSLKQSGLLYIAKLCSASLWAIVFFKTFFIFFSKFLENVKNIPVIKCYIFLTFELMKILVTWHLKKRQQEWEKVIFSNRQEIRKWTDKSFNIPHLRSAWTQTASYKKRIDLLLFCSLSLSWDALLDLGKDYFIAKQK